MDGGMSCLHEDFLPGRAGAGAGAHNCDNCKI